MFHSLVYSPDGQSWYSLKLGAKSFFQVPVPCTWDLRASSFLYHVATGAQGFGSSSTASLGPSRELFWEEKQLGHELVPIWDFSTSK